MAGNPVTGKTGSRARPYEEQNESSPEAQRSGRWGRGRALRRYDGNLRATAYKRLDPVENDRSPTTLRGHRNTVGPLRELDLVGLEGHSVVQQLGLETKKCEPWREKTMVDFRI